MRPSAEPGKTKHHFIGEEDPPVLQAWTKGTLQAEEQALGSISLGSPIFYRGPRRRAPCWAGTSVTLPTASTIHAFVRAPFDQ